MDLNEKLDAYVKAHDYSYDYGNYNATPPKEVFQAFRRAMDLNDSDLFRILWDQGWKPHVIREYIGEHAAKAMERFCKGWEG